MMTTLTFIQRLAISIIPLLFAITLHEVAHGWVASKLGDKTAQILGRLTLNPLKHIDLVGTIVVPITLFFLGGFIFGWAKPVPVNSRNFHHMRRDLMLVAIAGPLANFLMAIFWAFIAKLGIVLFAKGIASGIPITYMGQMGMAINLQLMILNLIPIPPLDGSRVLSTLLPPAIAYHYERLEPYSLLILIVLIATPMLAWIMTPSLMILWRLLATITGLPST
jgi:Zn-dependent protease